MMPNRYPAPLIVWISSRSKPRSSFLRREEMYTSITLLPGSKFMSQTFSAICVRNPNRVLSRTQIAEKVWDMNFEPGSNVIDVYISSLRKKVDRGFERELIHTIKGAGYRFGIMD